MLGTGPVEVDEHTRTGQSACSGASLTGPSTHQKTSLVAEDVRMGRGRRAEGCGRIEEAINLPVWDGAEEIYCTIMIVNNTRLRA